MVHAVNSGHPGGSLGCAEFLVVLYQNIMDRKEGFEMDGRRPFLPFKRAYFSCFLQRFSKKRLLPVAELAPFD
jgi:transketolase